MFAKLRKKIEENHSISIEKQIILLKKIDKILSDNKIQFISLSSKGLSSKLFKNKKENIYKICIEIKE